MTYCIVTAEDGSLPTVVDSDAASEAVERVTAFVEELERHHEVLSRHPGGYAADDFYAFNDRPLLLSDLRALLERVS